MSNYDINSNPQLVKLMIKQAKEAREKYYAENPDSLIPLFEEELRELGFQFEISDQTLGVMPKHKETVLPIAIRYYKLANEKGKYNEAAHFMSFFHHRGFDEVVPMLIEDFFNPDTPRINREFISDRLFQIHSKKYIPEYLKILSCEEYDHGNIFMSLLVSSFKEEKAIPIFINMLDNEYTASYGLCALSNYKREEFRPYFEKFLNHKNSFYRKTAKNAIEKIDKKLQKDKDKNKK